MSLLMFLLNSPSVLAVLLFLVTFTPTVSADLFIVSPTKGDSLSATSDIVVQWLDNGQSPLLSEIGTVSVGLYHGKQKLVQSIQSVNVAESQSLTFKAIPEAGPNSDSYYLSFISTSEELSKNGVPHAAFSPFFTLKDMKGSFSEPLDSATSLVSNSASPTVSSSELSTITVGTLSTALPSLTSLTPSVTPTSSRFSTAVSSNSAAASQTSSSAGSTQSSAPSSIPNSSSCIITSNRMLVFFMMFSVLMVFVPL